MTGQIVWRVALAGMVVAAAAALGAGPAASAVDDDAAAADATLEVEAGYAGGNFLPGRPVPVRVKVTTERLVRGDLRVELKAFGDPVPVVVPIEVAGGNPKEIVVALPTVPGLDRLDIVASLAGASATAKARFDEKTQVVGLLPGVSDDTPAPVPVDMDLGTMRFAQLDQATLATPGALAALGTVVAGPDGLGQLDESVQASVLEWIQTGGHLVVDSAVGDPVDGLPEAWQPGEAGRVTAGRGQVRAVAGAVARGSWAEAVELAPLVTSRDMNTASFMGDEVSNSLARGSGLKLPASTWLVAFLAVYVLFVGPVAFFVVRRTKRLRNVAWVAIGGLAAVFTAGAFVGGRDIRSNTRAAHASLVETGVAGTRSFSYLGLVSPSGTDPTIGMPAGWLAEPYFSPWDSELGGGLTSVRLGTKSTDAGMGLQAGGFGIMDVWGPVEGRTTGIEVTAVAAADGTVSGELRNTSDHALTNVLVMVANRAWDGGDLAAGEKVDWTLEPNEGHPRDSWTAPETPWIDFIGMDRPVPENAPVDYSLWAQARSQEVDPYAPGWVTAAGWTKSWVPPVEVGEELTGPTVFMTRAPITFSGATFPSDAVQREVLRAGTDDDPPEDIEMDFGPTTAAVVRFILPTGADPATALQATVASSVVGLDTWDGDSWEPVDCDLPDNPGMNDREDAATCELPATAVKGGSAYVKVHVFEGMSFWPGIRVGAVT